jgi:NCAIR mutase (PurE)-related protein
MARRKQNRIHGIDCAYFAGLYVTKLLKNTAFRVNELPQLIADSEYEKLSQYQRQDVRLNIRHAAREMYYAAGYNREVVDRIFNNNQ